MSSSSWSQSFRPLTVAGVICNSGLLRVLSFCVSFQAGIFRTMQGENGLLLENCASNWWDMSTMALIKAISILFHAD